MANTIKIIGAGGAGVTITNEVGSMLSTLGDGFAEVSRYYIDTSRNNLDDNIDTKRFHQVKSTSLSKTDISGSGSERRTHAPDIMVSVKEFMDNHKLLNKETNVYNLVVFSASGGSGSVLAPSLIKNFLEKDIPVIAVMVGDSTNGLSAINTLNTIATLHNISTKAKKALSVMYVNNESYLSTGINNAISDANKSIFNSLSALSLFLSGDNESIDAQDMINIIDQSKYATINIKPGLYALSTFSKDVILPEGCVATVARTLTTPTVSPDINLQLLHHKTGVIRSENAINIYKEHVPIHLVSYVNYFTIEEKRLKEYTDSIYNAMHAIEVNDVSGTSESEADEDGMVF